MQTSEIRPPEPPPSRARLVLGNTVWALTGGGVAVAALCLAAGVGEMTVSGVAAFAEGESSCTATPLSASLRERYSLPDLPRAEDVRFCEQSDRDGTHARLTFLSSPAESEAYLTRLGLGPAGFHPVERGEVDELARPDGDGWQLTKGRHYKAKRGSPEGNGHCFLSYAAYIQSTEDWDGRVYLAAFCAT
ncbi:hypothetical protein [Streptomyces erythrochromogenes]|uniref:hypothetical protein n=1 Tax=Streptomyces erythrochromogenes TaxID=285574 RepID=UPI00368981A2